MRWTAKLTFAAALLSAQMADARLAEVICDDRTRLETRLTNVFGASKQGQGMRGPDAVLEVWIEPRSGDWTLVQSYANGQSCIVAMGEHWEMLAPDTDPA
jgi:hypothetical protein